MEETEMEGTEMEVNTSGIFNNTTLEMIDITGHILEHLLNIFGKKNLKILESEYDSSVTRKIKNVFYTLIEESDYPNSLMSIDNLGGFESEEEFDKALILAETSRDGTNNRGFGSKLMFIHKLFVDRYKGGSGFILTVNKDKGLVRGYYISRKNHKHNPRKYIMTESQLSDIMSDEFLDEIFNKNYDKGIGEMNKFTIYFAQKRHCEEREGILRGVETLYKNYSRLNSVKIVNNLNIYMSKILKKFSHEIIVNDTTLKYNHLMDDIMNYTFPEKVIESKLIVTAYSTMSQINYMVQCLDTNIGLDKKIYKICRSKPWTECFKEITDTQYNNALCYDYVKFEVRILDIKADNWKEHYLKENYIKGVKAKEFKRIYITLDNNIIACPEFDSIGTEGWPNLRISITIDTNKCYQEDIERIIDLNKHKYKSNLNKPTRKIIHYIACAFQKHNGSKNKTKTKIKTSRKPFSTKTVLATMSSQGSVCSRTGIPLPAGFLDRHHKDGDSSNNNAENCEILHPLVHALITRGEEDMIRLINGNPSSFIYNQFEQLIQSEKLTDEDRQRMITRAKASISKKNIALDRDPERVVNMMEGSIL